MAPFQGTCSFILGGVPIEDAAHWSPPTDQGTHKMRWWCWNKNMFFHSRAPLDAQGTPQWFFFRGNVKRGWLYLDFNEKGSDFDKCLPPPSLRIVWRVEGAPSMKNTIVWALVAFSESGYVSDITSPADAQPYCFSLFQPQWTLQWDSWLLCRPARFSGFVLKTFEGNFYQNLDNITKWKIFKSADHITFKDVFFWVPFFEVINTVINMDTLWIYDWIYDELEGNELFFVYKL